MSQEEEILRLEDTLSLGDSDSEMFMTAEGASSDDGTGLSEEESGGPAGAEAPGQREEERPSGAKAPGSQQEIAPPGHRAWRKNKGRGRYGTGRRERRRRKALQNVEAALLVSDKGPGSPVPHTTVAPREAGGDPKSRGVSVTTGEPSSQGCPMVGCGRRVTDLRGHCLRDHVPEVFQDLSLTGKDFGRVRGSALQTILRVLGWSGGPIWVCSGVAGNNRMPGGPVSSRPRWQL